VIEKLANLPQPVISAIQGYCSTGGLELALTADLIVASESARFSETYSRWGLTPVWGLSLRLPHRVGTARAAEMMLTCRTYTGAQASRMNLVNVRFADDEFEKGLAALTADILANSAYASRVIKHALIESDELTLRDAHALELFKNEGVAPDAPQRVARFFKGRKGKPA
jgi:enoyl-CoA hydratase